MVLASLCYLQKDDTTLMLQRSFREGDIHSGKWNGLGGKFLPGETPEECARREVREESGLFGGELQLQGFITFPLFDGKKDWYVFVFTGQNFQGELQASGEGTLHWIENEKIHSLSLWEGDRIFLPWIYEDRFFSAKFIYTDGKFIEHDVVFYPKDTN